MHRHKRPHGLWYALPISACALSVPLGYLAGFAWSMDWFLSNYQDNPPQDHPDYGAGEAFRYMLWAALLLGAGIAGIITLVVLRRRSLARGQWPTSATVHQRRF